MEDKSDEWKESEAGQEAQERLDVLGALVDEVPSVLQIDGKALT